MAAVGIRRVYAPPEPGEGVAVLVDRLWPRGISKAAASWEHWLREVAPSTELRQWYGHQPDRFAEFQRRYHSELDAAGAAALARLRALAATGGRLTLVTSARAVDLSHAEVLRRLLAKESANGPAESEQEG